MRGRNKHWDQWDESHLVRRDFRDDKGGGPEVPRHRKEKPKKPVRHKGCPANDGGPHVYVWVEKHTVMWHNNYRTGEAVKRTDVCWKKVCVGCDHIKDYRWWREPGTPYEVEKIT